MSLPKPEPIMLLYTITERGDAHHILSLFQKHMIQTNLRCVGLGTASSETMDILGLATRDKDILISLGAKSAVDRLADEFAGTKSLFGRRKGILMTFPLTAISNLAASAIYRGCETLSKEGDTEPMKNEYKRSLILVAVNQGYTEDVMKTARKAGATGGTVLRGRLAGIEQLSQLQGIDLKEEKELITILVSDDIRDQVMEDINAAFGMKTKAQAILCSLAVDRAFKI